MKILTNWDNDELYCTYSKERIEIGEKYVLVDEECFGEVIEKPYKLENVPSENEDDIDLG